VASQPPDLLEFGPNGAKTVTTASSPVVAGSTQSLKVNVVLDEALSQRTASVSVALCQSGQVAVSGRTISVNVFFDSPDAFGSLSFLQAEAWGASVVDSCNLMFGGQMTIGTWHQASCQFSVDGSFDRVSVVIKPAPVSWTGTMYLDNVRID
jgi:hypothetical protein